MALLPHNKRRLLLAGAMVPVIGLGLASRSQIIGQGVETAHPVRPAAVAETEL
jgi:hypothetical protein